MPRGYLTVLLLGIVAICAVCLALRWRALSVVPPVTGPFLVEASAAQLQSESSPAPTAAFAGSEAAATPAGLLSVPPDVTEGTANANQPATAPKGKPASSGPLNINTASANELDTLPGIGPVLAKRIVDYRKAHGPFKRIEQLQDVEGIGPKKYADLKAQVYVEPAH